MKIISIKKHFATYSIYGKRKTTINAAFASAIAPTDEYDPTRLREAVSVLGQNPDEDLECVYCAEKAATWDHIKSRVKDGASSGAGHRLGNLLPSCRTCNEKKGQKNWREFLDSLPMSPDARRAREERISDFIEKYAVDEPPSKRTELHEKYDRLRHHIHELMQQADEVAKQIRELK